MRVGNVVGYRVEAPEEGVNDPEEGVNDPDEGVNDPDEGMPLWTSAESEVLEWLSFIRVVRERLTTPSSATRPAGATAARRGKGGGRKQRA